MRKPLLIRADANPAMGTGHLMRMIALAQAWREAGDDVVFVCAEITKDLEKRVKNEGFLIQKSGVAPGGRADLEATSAFIARHFVGSPLAPVVLDGYQFDSDFQRGLKAAGCRLLVIDDYGHADFYHADFVLNQNVSACSSLYAHRAPQTRLLLGSPFALLRQEFLKYRGFRKNISEPPRNILVTFGGTDPNNATQQVVESLAGLDMRVKVVVGSGSNNQAVLRKAFADLMEKNPSVELIVNPINMPDIMAWADVAVTAGGSTLWELAFMGLPSVIVIVAENQRHNAEAVHEAGMGICIGDYSNFTQSRLRQSMCNLLRDHALRKRMIGKSTNAVDGFGAARVIAKMQGA